MNDIKALLAESARIIAAPPPETRLTAKAFGITLPPALAKERK